MRTTGSSSSARSRRNHHSPAGSTDTRFHGFERRPEGRLIRSTEARGGSTSCGGTRAAVTSPTAIQTRSRSRVDSRTHSRHGSARAHGRTDQFVARLASDDAEAARPEHPAVAWNRLCAERGPDDPGIDGRTEMLDAAPVRPPPAQLQACPAWPHAEDLAAAAVDLDVVEARVAEGTPRGERRRCQQRSDRGREKTVARRLSWRRRRGWGGGRGGGGGGGGGGG